MAASLTSPVSIARPNAGARRLLRARARAPARAANAARVAVVRAATYTEVFDANSGQMVKTLSQAVETVSTPGLEWRYRVGVPEDGVEVKPNKVLLVHGAGMCAYTYQKLMRELQKIGYECVAPDLPGHGGTSKPSPSAFKYDSKAYADALEAFIAETDVVINGPCDLVVSGFYTSQHALLLAAKTPELFRRVVVLNAPLGNGHKLPDPLAVYSRPFGMGKGAPADIYKLAYFGNEFAIGADAMEEYEFAVAGPEKDAARDAFEATATAVDFKKLMEDVRAAHMKPGTPKIRVVWGVGDKYLNDAPMFKWAEDVRASFDCMRKVGHMPHEDFAEETARFVDAFLASDMKVSALGSVRLGKISKDDDYDR